MNSDEADLDILYVPLPQPRHVTSLRPYFTIGASVGVGVAAIVVLVAFGNKLPGPAVQAIMLLPIVLCFAGLVMLVVDEIRGVWTSWRYTSLDPTDDLPTSVSKLLLHLGVGRRRMVILLPWKGFNRERTRRGIPPLGIIVDDSVRGRLDAVGLTDHLLEPERLLPGKAGKLAVMATTVVGLSAVWLLYRGGMFWGPFLAAMFFVTLLQFPAVLALLPIVGDRSLPVAGPGYVDLPGDKRLTVRDSVMIVARGPRLRSVQAFLTGPAGHLCWSYTSLDDPEFVRLWQRWAHPNPRLGFDAV